jgi:hypothetical protein
MICAAGMSGGAAIDGGVSSFSAFSSLHRASPTTCSRSESGIPSASSQSQIDFEPWTDARARSNSSPSCCLTVPQIPAALGRRASSLVLISPLRARSAPEELRGDGGWWIPVNRADARVLEFWFQPDGLRRRRWRGRDRGRVPIGLQVGERGGSVIHGR